MNDVYDRGLAVRQAVLGDAAVTASIEGASEFDGPLQALVTEYCWGAVWARDELDRKTRSMLVVALLAALNRPAELAAHVRGAVRNGCSQAEIRGVLLHVAIYAGVPAGVTAFKVAKEALAEQENAEQSQ
jgi:4-carboxymuconolactone decarboxylase